MKGLNLRKLWSVMLLASMTLGAISCGESESVEALPDMKVIQCSAGDREELVFTAHNNWRLSSDAVWCKFLTSGGKLQDISGREGTHKITLVISNEQIKDYVTTAKISIIMGGKKAVIATIERAPDSYYFKIYDVAENDTKGVVQISYSGYTRMYIEANFDFAAVEYPDWVEVLGGSITGSAGEYVEALVRIVPNGDRERYPITKEHGHVMVFSDAEKHEDRTFVCPIIYNGMANDEIAIYGPTAEEFGWEVTPDGKSFSQVAADDTVVTFKNELVYNIVAHKDQYHMVYVENIIDRGIPSFVVSLEEDKNRWMHFNRESMALTIDATERVRYGYVLAVPQGPYSINASNFKNGEVLFETDNSSGIELPVLSNDYLKCVVLSFTQRGTVEVDPDTEMDIYHSLTAYDIPAMRYTDSEVMAQYGVEKAYIAPFVNSISDKKPYIVINPRIEGWSSDQIQDSTGDTIEFGMVGADVWYKGAKLSIDKGEYYIGENVDELLSLHLYGPENGFDIDGENIYVVFKLGDQPKKLLVVTPPTK